MACPPDTQDLNVDSTGQLDLRFVPLAVFLNRLLFDRSVGNVDLIFRNIDVIEKVFFHEPYVTLKFVRLHGIVFVEIECHDITERESFLKMDPDSSS